jgi:hypothetical protein
MNVDRVYEEASVRRLRNTSEPLHHFASYVVQYNAITQLHLACT